eukprot:TRINITY_DN28903_c0_g1_i1.p1 TRINITY_DN28903_c0_g1~~TRINITY_DN28903_c0_g1_i1.p1  ORF type:complete len:158 (+),score=34.97 TRINITY_DN28903_c0_g1_i1:1-474(+)
MRTIEEKLARVRYEIELEGALEKGFDEVQLREMHDIFSLVDADNSGLLDERELQTCLRVLVRQGVIPKESHGLEHYDDLAKMLNLTGPISLDFGRFVDVIKTLAEGQDSYQRRWSRLKGLTLLSSRQSTLDALRVLHPDAACISSSLARVSFTDVKG